MDSQLWRKVQKYQGQKHQGQKYQGQKYQGLWKKVKNIKVLRQSTAHAHSQRRIEPRAARRQRSGRSSHHQLHLLSIIPDQLLL